MCAGFLRLIGLLLRGGIGRFRLGVSGGVSVAARHHLGQFRHSSGRHPVGDPLIPYESVLTKAGGHELLAGVGSGVTVVYDNPVFHR